MNIAGIEYNLNYKALEIYISGCNSPHCDNCHNKELWNYTEGKYYLEYIPSILSKINTGMINHIWLLGGEPLDQDENKLLDLILKIKQNVSIWLWTRYYEIPNNILNNIDYAKIGEFNQKLKSYKEPLFGITLVSNNQKIIKINTGKPNEH